MRGWSIGAAPAHWRAAAAAALLVATIVVGWLQTGIAQDGDRIVAARESWSEPSTQSKDPGAVLARLAQHPLWRIEPRQNAGVAAPSLPPATKWHLAGVIADRDHPSAVIFVERQGAPGEGLQYRQVGDQLPDGARLVAISVTSITVESGGVQKQMKLLSGR